MWALGVKAGAAAYFPNVPLMTLLLFSRRRLLARKGGHRTNQAKNQFDRGRDDVRSVLRRKFFSRS